MKRARGLLFGTTTLLLLLVLMYVPNSPLLAGEEQQGGCPDACTCGCYEVCVPDINGGVRCYDECNVCGATATPVPGTTPQPTATPLPIPYPYTCDGQYCYVETCIRDACPSDDYANAYRYARIVFTYDGQYVSTSYLKECGEPPCDMPEGGEGKAGECIIDGSGIINDVVNCLGEYEVSVSLRLPAWHANRDPYPRGMVYVPTRFWMVDAPAAEAWSAPVDIGDADEGCDADHVGVINDWKIGLRTEPALLSPHWEAEECGAFDGPVGSCTWQKASWGKPYLGVGKDGEPLPAYRVTGWLPYNWFSRTTWDECVEEYKWGECGCSGVDPTGSPDWQDCGDPPPGICVGVYDDPQTEWWGKWREPEYRWQHHDSGWRFIDLTLFGYPTSWMPNPNVQQVPTALEPNPPVGALYVPVIEVQSTNEE